MSAAKAALQIDARQLAHNLGKYNIRVNLISAGPYASRAARAIGDIQQMIQYAAQRSPLPRPIQPEEVANAVFVPVQSARLCCYRTDFVRGLRLPHHGRVERSPANALTSTAPDQPVFVHVHRVWNAWSVMSLTSTPRIFAGKPALGITTRQRVLSSRINWLTRTDRTRNRAALTMRWKIGPTVFPTGR
jgi:hypothetical protein